MKRLLLLIMLMANGILSYAETICHTGGNYDDLLHGNVEHFGKYRVRVFFHILRTSTGGGYDAFPVEDILLCVQRLNYDYQSSTYGDITFDYAGMDYIDNTEYYNMSSYDSFYFPDMMNTNRHPDAIDVYLLPTNTSIAGIAEGIPGTALAVGGSSDYIILGESSVLSHEMGHCLGLFHTFHGSPSESYHSCPELVGVYTSSCGDFVPDTEADPFPLYDHLSSCTWFNTEYQDIYGNYYRPDPRQIMADVPAGCMSKLTYDQGYRVRTYINNVVDLRKRTTPVTAYVQDRQFFGNGEEIILAEDSVIAGRNVTMGQNGNVVVPSGGNVTFQAEKKVTLKPGFKVNLGGKFHAKVNALPVPNYVRKNFSDTGGDYMPLFDNTSWIKVRHNSGDLRVWADIYTNAGDSIFEGKKYRVIKEREIYVDEPTLNPQEWIYLFYEDLENKRTYVYDDFRQKDRLLYDFSVRVGDRLPSDEDSNFILKDISTMDNSGHTRKQYTFVHESDTIVWLEGIGNCNDFTRPYFRKHDGVKMLCVQKENETIYDTSTTEEKSCDDINQIYENLLVHEDITDIYIDNSPSATKILRDGQIFILRGDKTYTIQGIEINK